MRLAYYLMHVKSLEYTVGVQIAGLNIPFDILRSEVAVLQAANMTVAQQMSHGHSTSESLQSTSACVSRVSSR